jgi:beta-glucosidase
MKYIKQISALLAFNFLMAPACQAANPIEYFNSLSKTTKIATAIVAAGITATAIGTVAYKGLNSWYKESLYWNWEKINPTLYNNQSVAELFKKHRKKLALAGSEWLWGVGTSAHQVEGNCTNNNWYEWSQLPEQQARGMVDAGKACNHWNTYKEDIKLMQKLGVNTYRFSVEWSKVMPAPGVIDQNVLDHYEDVCKELVSHGIKPVITLFHYTEPLWFYHKQRHLSAAEAQKSFPHLSSLVKDEELILTGWEDPANITYFVQFCQATFDRLHSYVHLWLTFNSPEGHALQGWYSKDKPPAKKNMSLAMEVLKNLLEAHVHVYQTLKARPGGMESKIGILKNTFQIDPWDYCNPLDHIGAAIGNKIQNDTVFNFLRTGSFSIYIPFMVNVEHTNKYLAHGGKCLDFIGLNYYSHGYIKNFKTVRDEVREIPTNNKKYTIYAEGFYLAIKELSDIIAKPLGIPIYVTENGIGADTDEHRLLFNKRYLYALTRALEEGYDVRGYILWSFMDNYEWGVYAKRYGVFHVDFATQERTLKKGADYFVKVVNASQDKPIPVF